MWLAAYITEVESAIDFVRRSPSITLEEKRRFFKSTNRNVGSSALCLSGGATFGYCTENSLGHSSLY
jgi:hypothetical protein